MPISVAFLVAAMASTVPALASGAELEIIDDLTAIDPETGELVHLASPGPVAPSPPRQAGAVAGANDGATVCSLSNDNAHLFDLTSRVAGSAIDLKPDGNYPYDATMNPAETEIWIAGASGDHVMVLDRVTGAVIQRIAVGEYPVSVTFSHDGALAFVGCRSSEWIEIIDTATYLPGTPLVMPDWVGQIAVDPVSHLVYVAAWYRPDLWEVAADGSALLRTATALGDSLWQLVVSPDGETIYVTDRDPTFPMVRIVDRATLTELGNITVSKDPWGLDITGDCSTLVVAAEDDEAIDIIDLATQMVTTIPVTGDDPRDVDILEATGEAFVVNGRASVHVIDIATRTITDTFDVGCGSTNALAVQGPLPPKTSCTAPIPAVDPIYAIKNGDDVEVVWSRLTEATSYNLWRVDTKDRIDEARWPPTANVTEICRETPALTCTDPGEVRTNTNRFYQARGVCGGNEGA